MISQRGVRVGSGNLALGRGERREAWEGGRERRKIPERTRNQGCVSRCRGKHTTLIDRKTAEDVINGVRLDCHMSFRSEGPDVPPFPPVGGHATPLREGEEPVEAGT